AVYVSPSGARAASAGFLITISAHIAAMAPGTNMGAAHPVSIIGKDIDEVMKKKITNDAVSYVKSIAGSRGRNTELSEKAVRDSSSFTAFECLEGNLIDFVVKDIDELINKADGFEILSSGGKKEILNISNKTVHNISMTMRQRFLRTITNPNLAYFLLIIGLAGLYIEFTHPGVIIPGVIGGIALLLAFLAFQVLPINYTGLFLILLSIGFFIAEIKIQGFGILGIGGILSFVLGSVMLINSPIPELRPAVATIVTATGAFGAVFLFLAYKVITVSRRKAETGSEGMIGEKGKTRSPVNSLSGKVFIKGEIWNAISDEPIPAGEIVEILSVNNLMLKVKKGE
ncbi:MAG: nodulation protein NfeD, partial [Candidatus Aminicenantes bacterium]|nr:nodulation protein NfeD [Candidatus Aminicenantes bacterium]